MSSNFQFDPELYLPERWKNVFKGKSNAEINKEISIHKLAFDCYGSDAYPIYNVILKALEDNEPYQAEKRERKRLKELNKERQLEWDRETGCTKRMNELANHLKLHPGKPLPYTMDDIIRECKAIKPRPVDLIYPGDELPTLEAWQEEITQLQEEE